MFHDTIRIGTLVGGGASLANDIEQRVALGFESFSITFWGTVPKADLKRLAQETSEVLAGTDAVISSLAVFTNPMLDGEEGNVGRVAWRTLIDSAHLFGCDIVAGFTGRVPGKSIPDNMPRFKKVYGPLAKRAADRGVRIAFENCTRTDSWHTGSRNIAISPPAWDLIFDAIPADNVGLEWEPAHQMVNLIDPMPQLRKYVKKMFHLHGKDATVMWDVVREHGINGPVPFVYQRTPGFGDCNWTDIISELRRGGFAGSIDIEGAHDPVYSGKLEMTSQVRGLDYLKECRGGKFVPNPE